MLSRISVAISVVGASIVLAHWGYMGPPIFVNMLALAAAPDQKLVALSFDDGPNPPYTEQLLDVLAEEGVPATFFMTGKYVARYPETVARVVAAGQTVGNHGWDEARLARMSPAGVRASFDRTEAALHRAGVGSGRELLVRAAGLAVGYAGAWVFREDGRSHIHGRTVGDWTSEPIAATRECARWSPEIDCPTQDADRLVQRVLDVVEPGMILILHDGHDQFVGVDRSGTVAATRQVIRALRAKGYRFVAIESGGLHDDDEAALD